MTSSFNVNDATAYEQLMGRWSKKLAPLLIDFAGLAEGERIIDVGCGNGSLTFALARAPELREIVAIDYSPVFVEAAIQRNSDPRIKIRQADACSLPFEDGSFDRALALLVLHFVPEAGKAVAEMRRVVRKGGVVAAAVWDHLGGMPGMRMMIDTVAALSEGGRKLRARYCFQPMMQPGEMKRTFVEQGLLEVTETELMIRMDYQSFDDYWVAHCRRRRTARQIRGHARCGRAGADRRRSARRLRSRSARRPEIFCEHSVGLPRDRALIHGDRKAESLTRALRHSGSVQSGVEATDNRHRRRGRIAPGRRGRGKPATPEPRLAL